MSGCRGLPVRGAGPACAPWVPDFLAATYFQPCERHRHHKKNECTFFCVTCVEPQSVCQHCMGAHAGHQVIQVRRYVYCDVVRACDINPYVDTTGVQTYIINSAKVLFLHHRPQSKLGRPNGPDVCATCCRHLREGATYCSLACKVESLTKGSPSCSPVPSAAATAVTTAAAAARRSVTPCAPASVAAAAGRCYSGCDAPSAGFTSPSRRRHVAPAAAAAAAPPVMSGCLPRDRLLAAAAAAAAALKRADAAAAASASANADADTIGSDSSEHGEESLPYGSGVGDASAGVVAASGGRIGGYAASVARARARALAAKRTAALAAAAAAAAEAEERDTSCGSASSEDERFDLHFENAPKRRRSSATARRPVVISRRGSHDSATEYGAVPYGAAVADPSAAAAAEAAATLMMPYSSGSLDSAAVACGGAAANSRRKRSVPQRAPTY